MTKRFDPEFDDYEREYDKRDDRTWERDPYQDFSDLDYDQDVDFDSIIDDMD